MAEEQVKVQPTEPVVVHYGPKEEPPTESAPVEPGAAVVEESTPKSETQAETSGPQFAADQLARARQFGLNEDSFKSPAALEHVLTLLEREVAEKHEPSAAPVEEEEVEPFKLDLGEDVDETIAKTIKGLNEHYAAALSKIRKESKAAVREAAGKVDLVAGRASEQIFDQQIAAQDKAWEEVFGTGKTRSLNRKSPEFEARIKLLESIREVQEIQARRPAHLQASDEEVFSRALLLSFGDRYEKIIRAQVAAQLKKTTHTNRPEQRNGTASASTDPTDRARSFASSFMRERGF